MGVVYGVEYTGRGNVILERAREIHYREEPQWHHIRYYGGP